MAGARRTLWQALVADYDAVRRPRPELERPLLPDGLDAAPSTGTCRQCGAACPDGWYRCGTCLESDE